jgi:acetyl-CoA synthetase
MTKKVIYEISQNIKNDSLVSEEEFSDMYQHSITKPDEFWHEQASSYLEWISKWDQVSEHDFSKGHVCWFKG